MATEEINPEELIRKVNEEIMWDGNVALIDEVFAEDYIEHNPALPTEIRGRDDMREKVEMFQKAFSNADGTTEAIIADGNMVADRHRFKATHDGEFMDMPPTGNEIDVEGIAFYRLEDGKVAEMWTQADVMGMMEQLGMFPPGPKLMLKMVIGKLKSRVLGG